MERYPSKQELDFITGFDCTKQDPFELVRFLQDIWAYGWDGYFSWDENTGLLELHTSGWSGNEDIINALGKNKWFWMLYWTKIERGGHYYFEVKRMKKDE